MDFFDNVDVDYGVDEEGLVHGQMKVFFLQHVHQSQSRSQKLLSHPSHLSTIL